MLGWGLLLGWNQSLVLFLILPVHAVHFLSRGRIHVLLLLARAIDCIVVYIFIVERFSCLVVGSGRLVHCFRYN